FLERLFAMRLEFAEDRDRGVEAQKFYEGQIGNLGVTRAGEMSGRILEPMLARSGNVYAKIFRMFPVPYYIGNVRAMGGRLVFLFLARVRERDDVRAAFPMIPKLG